MPDRDDVVARLIQIVRQAPQSAESLTLYALANTLAFEKSGCLFKLTKLEDLQPSSRVLAYDLMEILVSDADHAKFFSSLKQQLDDIIRLS